MELGFETGVQAHIFSFQKTYTWWTAHEKLLIITYQGNANQSYKVISHQIWFIFKSPGKTNAG